MLNSRDFTFELVCHSIESWHQTVKIFESTKSKGAAKELGVKICELALEIIGKMEAREAARLRNEAKLKKARELELVPRKRSRRLEVKVKLEFLCVCVCLRFFVNSLSVLSLMKKQKDKKLRKKRSKEKHLKGLKEEIDLMKKRKKSAK